MKLNYITLTLFLFLTFFSNAWATSIIGPIFHNKTNRLFVGGVPASSVELSDDLLKSIIVYDLELEKVVKKLTFEDEVSCFSVSSSGYLAVVLTSYSDPLEERENKKTKLLIIDTDYHIIESIPDVSELERYEQFEWDKSGTKIVYLTSVPLPYDSEHSEKPTGTWLFDAESRTRSKLCDFGTDVSWGKHDGNIYIRKGYPVDPNSSIYLYNISNGSLKETDKNGLEFSNNGRFYACVYSDGERTYDYIYSIDNNIIYNYGDGDILLYNLGTNNVFLNNSSYLLSVNSDFYELNDMEKLVNDNNCTIRKSTRKVLGLDVNLTLMFVVDSKHLLSIEDIISGSTLKKVII